MRGRVVVSSSPTYFSVIYFCRDLRNEAKELNCNSEEPFQLYDQVLRCNPGAFEYAIPGK
ncbi:hypothetical protein F2Q68_00007366 [Brassica cretica]|uniref:Uncharacterized protein n=1 Tax=Brassica cretica TaxID=69181 RepID=A0A8S9KQI7_BRACR|nr:hypothetical protein F2Q68_00007366 [Brassica cretica]